MDSHSYIPSPIFNGIDHLNALEVIAKKPGGACEGFVGISNSEQVYCVKFQGTGYVGETLDTQHMAALESFSAQLIRAIWGEDYAVDIRLVPLSGSKELILPVSKNHQHIINEYQLSPIAGNFYQKKYLPGFYAVISPYEKGVQSVRSVMHKDFSFKKAIEILTIGELLGVVDMQTENTIADSNGMIKLLDCEAIFKIGSGRKSDDIALNIYPYNKFDSLVKTSEGKFVIDTFLKFDSSQLEQLLAIYKGYLPNKVLDEIRTKMQALKNVALNLQVNQPLQNDNADKINYLANSFNLLEKSFDDLSDKVIKDVNDKNVNDSMNQLMNAQFQMQMFLNVYSEIIVNNLNQESINTLQQYHAYRMFMLGNKRLKTVNFIKAKLDYLHSDYKSKLHILLNQIKPASTKAINDILDPNASFGRFILKNPAALPQGMSRVCLYRLSNDTYVIEITDNNKVKKLFEFEHIYFTVSDVITIIAANGGIIDAANAARHKGTIDDDKWKNLNLYDQEIEMDYKKIHEKIASHTIKCIKENKQQPVEILFVGCGQGNEVRLMMDVLKKNKIAYRIYGLDKNPENIVTAKANIKSNAVFFMAGDASNIDEHMCEFRKLASKAKTKMTTKITITIASGFLTRKVVTPQNAYETFQKIASFSNHIIISGRTEGIVLRRDAKKCGMKISQEHYESYKDNEHSLDSYEFITLTEQVKVILDSAMKANDGILNLSGHARPLDVIKHIEGSHSTFFNKMTMIKLNDSYIHES